MTKGCPKHCSTVTTSPASASPALDSPQMLEQRHLKVLHQILSTAWNRPCRSAESVREAVGFFMGFGRVIQRDSDDVTLYEKFWRRSPFWAKTSGTNVQKLCMIRYDVLFMCYSWDIHENTARVIASRWTKREDHFHYLGDWGWTKPWKLSSWWMLTFGFRNSESWIYMIIYIYI